MASDRVQVRREFLRPLVRLPQAGRVLGGLGSLAGVAVIGWGAATALGALAAVLIVLLALAIGTAALALIALRSLADRHNELRTEVNDREARRPRLEVARAHVIPRGFGVAVQRGDGQEVQGAEPGMLFLIEIVNRPTREYEGEEARDVSAEITVSALDGTILVDGSRGHWTDAALGDYTKTIPAGASAVPLDVIAKLDDLPVSFVYSERGVMEAHLVLLDSRYYVDVLIKGHNTPALRARYLVEHDGAKSRLRIQRQSPARTR